MENTFNYKMEELKRAVRKLLKIIFPWFIPFMDRLEALPRSIDEKK